MTRLLESATGLAFLEPAALLLAIPILLLALLRARRAAPSLAFTLAPVVAPPGRGLPRSLRSRLLPLPGILHLLGILLAVLALARPVERTPLPLRSEGIDLLLCIDASSSMTAEDLERGRTRLDTAKAAAAEFLAARPADRVGLLRFARWPDLLCPPTLDHRALGEVLASVATVEGDGPEDATGIGAAAARAAEVLSGGSSPSKVAVLLTDGEENVALAGEPGAIAPLHAGQLAARLGVRIHVVAAGAPEEEGPGARAVRGMAERTGGRYFRARDAAALRAVYASIDGLERAPFERPGTEVEERFPPFLLAALGLLLAGRLLRGTWLEVLP